MYPCRFEPSSDVSTFLSFLFNRQPSSRRSMFFRTRPGQAHMSVTRRSNRNSMLEERSFGEGTLSRIAESRLSQTERGQSKQLEGEECHDIASQSWFSFLCFLSLGSDLAITVSLSTWYSSLEPLELSPKCTHIYTCYTVLRLHEAL